MYQHILISTDGSEVAQKGVDHGLDLAKTLGAKVTIITVVEFFYPYVDLGGSPYAQFSATFVEEAKKLLSATAEIANRIGVAVETIYLENVAPADAIVDAASARNCDLIVMSSHGHRGVRRLLLGSVTSQVLARSPVPVLVVRMQADEQ